MSDGHTWASNQWQYGADSVFIELADTNYKLGVYYIAVYGYDSTVFTVTANAILVDQNPNDATEVRLYNIFPQVRILCVSPFH